MGAMVLDGVWTAILGEVQAMLRCMAEAEEKTMTSAGVTAHTVRKHRKCNSEQ